MKKASIRELRNEFPKVASWLEQGEEILVTRRSRPVAKLVPIEESAEEEVDWSKSAALRLNRTEKPISKKAARDVLADSGGSF